MTVTISPLPVRALAPETPNSRSATPEAASRKIPITAGVRSPGEDTEKPAGKRGGSSRSAGRVARAASRQPAATITNQITSKTA